MNSRTKILALIAGILTALLLVFYAYQDFTKSTSALETKKPATYAPAIKIFK